IFASSTSRLSTTTIAGALAVGTTNTGLAQLTVAATTPTVISSELITNGTFTGSATGWTLESSCSIYSSNQVTVLYNSTCQSDSNDPELSTTVSLTAGHTYEVSADITLNGDQPSIYFGNDSYESEPLIDGHNTVFFTADYTGSDIIHFASWNSTTDTG